MVPALSQWSHHLLADGVALVPPAGQDLGTLTLREHLRPLRSIADIAARVAATAPDDVEAPQAGPIDRFLTIEGEYAALTTLTAGPRTGGAAGAAPWQAIVGMIFGDDFHAQWDTVVRRPDLFDAVYHLVRDAVWKTPLGLGAERRRPFLYVPPDGWQGLARGTGTEWYPLDFPRQRARIMVWQARPLRQYDELAAFDRLLHGEDLGDLFKERAESEPVASRHGLRGTLVHLIGSFSGGPWTFYEEAVLEDSRFRYRLRLESGEDRLAEHRAIFKGVVASAWPIPSVEEGGPSSLVHWIE